MQRAAKIVIQWEWLILLFISPILFFPTGWRGLFLLVIPLLWLARRLTYGYFIPHTTYDLALLGLATALLISLAAVFDIAISFPKIAGLILGMAYFFAGIEYIRENSQRMVHLPGLIFSLGTAMVIVGLMGSLRSPYYGLLSPLTNLIPRSFDQYFGFFETAVNPNELAGILSWVIPLLLACTIGFWGSLWKSRVWWHKIVLGLLVLMLVFNSYFLIATQSRGGLMAVLSALLVMVAVRYRWGRWLFLIVVILGIAAIFSFDLAALFQGDPSTAVDLGFQGRLEIWSRALYGLADFPITGMGMNGFRHIVHLLYPLFTIDPGFDIGHAHNHLLQAGLDLGLLGLISYISIWVLSLALLWYSWRRSNSRLYQVLILGLSGSFTAGWMFGIFDTIALGARPGFIWWLLLALLFSIFEHNQLIVELDNQAPS